MERKVIESEKVEGIWFCIECSRPINEGYSHNGRCVVCAEKDLNPDYQVGYER